MTSSYFSSLRGVVWHGIKKVVFRDEAAALRDSMEMLIGLRKLELASYRFFHSLRLTTIMDLQVLSEPGVTFAASSDSFSIGPVTKLSVGAFSRTFSIPSVSGPALKACSYHNDLALSNSCQMSKRRFQSNVATSRSTAAFGESDFGSANSKHGQILLLPYSATDSYRERSTVSRRQAGILLRNQRKPHNAITCRYIFFHGGNGLCIFSAFSGTGSRHFHSSATTCLSAGTVRDVSFNSTSGKPLETDAISLERRISSERCLKLLSGSCYLPHPDKEETGGEDAHFICVDEQAIGVADGVGGWKDLGVDAGLYSRELMSNTVSAIQEEPKGSLNLARVLEKAHSSTKSKGSSTACIIALTDKGLHAINLGDSGFMVVRDGCTIFRSPVQQHDFNFTYQLESGNNGDLPSSGQVFAVSVASGDVIIAGTDGLFDNLYSNEITALVVQAMRAGSGPQLTAQKIAALARDRALTKDRQTPFSRAAQDAGYRYYGGKLDDITVVVSYITSCTQKR